MKSSRTWKRIHRGYTLLEVLIGIVIFALGIMALAQLQGNLSKSSADANARSVATNVAEETIERARTFSQITAGVGVTAFNDIVNKTDTTERGGINYTVEQVVTDYYYNPADGTFGPKPAGSAAAHADMKKLQVTVSWGTGQQFQIDQTQPNVSLGSGSIALTDLISSITSPSGGKVVLNGTTNEPYGPPVDYNPGQNPDIVSIQLGANRFKESTTPLPVVFNANERVETKFDVVTYSQNDEGATFLRREEFLAVSCECKLRFPTDATGGLRPTLWNGNDYTEGEFVSKPYGESVRDNATNFQSQYCSVCCRDHHDGGTGLKDDASDPGRSKYDPFRNDSGYMTADDGPAALIGDHKHYGLGGVGLANSDGATYYEACRLIRKDGFFRVAQDLRQEGLNSFPASYLDDDNEVATYSAYVTGAVSDFEDHVGNGYENSPPTLLKPTDMSPAVNFPGNSTGNRTVMSSANYIQQLRDRGVYIDYMTDELRDIINCLDLGGTGPNCGAEGVNSALEVIPFFDVQLTWLGRWNENPVNYPISVSNDEAIKTGNTHDRGRARLTSGSGNSDVTFKIHGGNLGLTGSDPIDPYYSSKLRQYILYMLADVDAPQPVISGYRVNGSITSLVGGVKASDVEIAATNGAQCNRTLTGFECIVPPSASNPRLTVKNYFKLNKDLVACSAVLIVNGNSHSGTDPLQNWTRFNLPQTGDISSANIYIKEGVSCP